MSLFSLKAELSKFEFSLSNDFEVELREFSNPMIGVRSANVIVRLLLALTMPIALTLGIRFAIQKKFVGYYGIYLTTWSAVVQTLYFLQVFVATVSNRCLSSVFYVVLLRLLRAISLPTSIAVTVCFWTLVYSNTTQTEFKIRPSTVMLHCFNTVITCVDIFISNYSYNLKHGIYAVIFGATYSLWTYVHYVFDIGTGRPTKFIYKPLDWSLSPGVAAMYCCLAVFVLLPLFILTVWFLVFLRDQLFSTKKSETDSIIP